MIRWDENSVNSEGKEFLCMPILKRGFEKMSWSWRTLKQLQAVDLTVDMFWNAVHVWNTKPHLLIKHLMGAEQLVSDSLAGDSSNVIDVFADLQISWDENPSETFQKLGFKSGDDVLVEVWKLLTKKPVDWNDYLRLSIFGKIENRFEFQIPNLIVE